MEYGSVERLIDSTFQYGLPEDAIRCIVFQIILALQYLHDQHIIHRYVFFPSLKYFYVSLMQYISLKYFYVLVNLNCLMYFILEEYVHAIFYFLVMVSYG